MKTSLTVYVEGDVVEEMHKRHLNLSKTTERALRRELFPEQVNP
jgi:post-segregation antitoxin (ccd killing protein)